MRKSTSRKWSLEQLDTLNFEGELRHFEGELRHESAERLSRDSHAPLHQKGTSPTRVRGPVSTIFGRTRVSISLEVRSWPKCGHAVPHFPMESIITTRTDLRYRCPPHSPVEGPVHILKPLRPLMLSQVTSGTHLEQESFIFAAGINNF